MNVVIKDKNNFIKCKDIPKSEIFIYDGNVYLKISTINYYTIGHSIPIIGNVVHLKTGSIVFIDDNVACELVDATVQVER